jgi:hypothetical protein
MPWEKRGILLRLFLNGFSSAQSHLIEMTLHLFFGAAKLPQAPLDLLDSQPALYFLECVSPVGLVELFLHGGLRVTKFPDHPIKQAVKMPINRAAIPPHQLIDSDALRGPFVATLTLPETKGSVLR